jgi:uncharacterized protein
VAPEERLAHIDFIRGCALLGVLVMNVQYFFRGPAELYVGADGQSSPGFLNDCVDDALRLLVEGKAMTLFSMLFAVGLAIQLERREASDGGFWPFAWRRMGALFAIGVAHIVLIWNGDILAIYAATALLLFPFLRRKTRTLKVWLAVLFGLATLAVLVFGFIRIGSPPPDAEKAKRMAEAAAWAQASLAGYGESSWWGVLLFRLRDAAHHASDFLTASLVTFLNFLLGLALWRTGVLQNPTANLQRIRRAAFWMVGAGLATGVILLNIKPLVAFARSHGLWAKVLVTPLAATQVYHMPLLGTGFGALLLLLWQSGRGRAAAGAVAAAGRMALTNYLAQSVVMTALFYGWGLGLYGKLGPATALALSSTFFSLQVAASRWWLQRYRYGPVEWLWRCAGYARVQPFRVLQSMSSQQREGPAEPVQA